MAMMSRAKQGMFMNGLFRTYLYRNLYRDFRKFARRTLRRVDFDSDHLLHRAGLTRYKPVRRTFSSLGLLVLGGIGGAVAALALAPKPGHELRSEVKERARKLLEQQRQAVAEGRAPEVRA
ncbi:MAG: YtxH domain-containing protein [Myxococcaceae bacterium]